jgi:hypothetical protein
MTYKHFMIFQTAVRKYVDMHEKNKSGCSICFYLQISKTKSEKILDEKCVKFF